MAEAQPKDFYVMMISWLFQLKYFSFITSSDLWHMIWKQILQWFARASYFIFLSLVVVPIHFFHLSFRFFRFSYFISVMLVYVYVYIHITYYILSWAFSTVLLSTLLLAVVHWFAFVYFNLIFIFAYFAMKSAQIRGKYKSMYLYSVYSSTRNCRVFFSC